MKRLKLTVKDIEIEWKDLNSIIKQLGINDLTNLVNLIAEEVKTRIICTSEGWQEAKEYVELKGDKK